MSLTMLQGLDPSTQLLSQLSSDEDLRNEFLTSPDDVFERFDLPHEDRRGFRALDLTTFVEKLPNRPQSTMASIGSLYI